MSEKRERHVALGSRAEGVNVQATGAGEKEKEMQTMDAQVARKLVKYVSGNPGVTWGQIEQQIPELAGKTELKEFAADGYPADKGFLVRFENDRVYLGAAAHLVQ